VSVSLNLMYTKRVKLIVSNERIVVRNVIQQENTTNNIREEW
jgi:hypothetical protein